LVDASAATGDSDENEDLQFYLAYMNNSGIEAAYSAFEKIEHDLTFGELLSDNVYDVLKAVPTYGAALDTTIFHINATAPFQQLVQHFTTPWKDDVFVTNNFMSLIAYSSSPTDQIMGQEDQLYMGYTFSVQGLIDALNTVLDDNGHTADQFDHFEVTPYFERVGDGEFRFGIRYTNMFVLWQKMDVAPRGVNIFGTTVPDQFISSDTGGIVFGHDIAAASLLDFIEFEYIFTTEATTIGTNEVILGTVETHYNIGETNLLIIKDEAGGMPTANWNHTPLADVSASYLLDIPDILSGFDIPGAGTIPTAVNIIVPGLNIYLDDDAKSRIRMANGFGITVATATTTFGVSVQNPSYTDNTGAASPTLDLAMGGNTYFFTDFEGKDTYKLKGLQDLWGIDPTVDRPVYIIPFDPTGWTIYGAAKIYFAVEFALAYGFTKFIAEQLTPQLFEMAGDATVYVDTILYFTFTEFPEWYGGEIYHDPAYSAVAAVTAATDTSTTDLPGTTTTGGTIPGFELVTGLLAIVPLFALFRKRRT
ncbi:MAG: hypothetical protein ACW99Q_20750, partial [Candidatus Kariarchaeaceae archaeon]